MTLWASRKEDIITVQCIYGPTIFKVEERLSDAKAFLTNLTRVVDEPAEDRAQKGYERYFTDCGGKSVHGDPLPAWSEQDEKIRRHWIAAFTE